MKGGGCQTVPTVIPIALPVPLWYNIQTALEGIRTMPLTIGLVAAMPEEIKPLLKKAGRFSREPCDSFTLYRFALADRQICLMESGMGARRAAAATRALIAACSPSMIINIGFAGAVTNGVSVGDIVIATRVIDGGDGEPDRSEFSAGGGDPALMQPQLSEAPGRYLATAATFISAQRILNKRELAARLPRDSGDYVLDMETATVVAAARDAKLPVLAIRAVSDGADEELGFSIDEFTDESMTVRPWRVLTTIAKKPWIIPQLIRLAGNVKRAGNNLSDALIDALHQLPPHT